MKTCCISRGLAALCGCLIVGGFSGSARSTEPTAFELLKEANRYVGEQAKDKVVQIRSEKSVGSLTPNVWYVVLYDPTATLKAQEVKFGSGKMLSVKRPMRLLEPVTGGDLPLNREQLKVDSDKAIALAQAEPILKDIKITNTQLKLERVGEGVLGQGGGSGQAIWKVKVWAAKLRNPVKTADLGELWISAADGKMIRNDVHLNRID